MDLESWRHTSEAEPHFIPSSSKSEAMLSCLLLQSILTCEGLYPMGDDLTCHRFIINIKITRI